ncbi:KaiB domain-containing protein [Thioflavicoccus mobilis 8321]|uniref:KaiB domain-containing protein n=1 Tax=Thioflavicoccus mobilis 8321 TaxID=765912 RepID=L0GWN4_9GAMM|nr:circadian clock KaiB family protein [Thioflavicoccus mobilis]AGA89780.1 KaiB domain-containing protein [Thioflavicoccus mobilis 8321]
MSSQLLSLYIAGRTAAAERALRNLKEIISPLAVDGRRLEIEVIDILEHPQLAEDDRILATPVVIKKRPPPVRRVVGDLSEHDKVLIGLDLKGL